MAKNVVKVELVADSRPLDAALAQVKDKLSSALLSPTKIGLASFNVWQMGFQALRAAAGKVADAFLHARARLAQLGAETLSTAKSLDAPVDKAVRLEAAARAASVSARDYERAMEAIKRGETTLDKQLAAWEGIAKSSKLAAERARGWGAILADLDKRRGDERSALEREAESRNTLSKLGATVDRLVAALPANGEARDLTAADVLRAFSRDVGYITSGRYEEEAGRAAELVNEIAAQRRRAGSDASAARARNVREVYEAAGGGDAALEKAAEWLGITVAEAAEALERTAKAASTPLEKAKEYATAQEAQRKAAEAEAKAAEAAARAAAAEQAELRREREAAAAEYDARAREVAAFFDRASAALSIAEASAILRERYGLGEADFDALLRRAAALTSPADRAAEDIAAASARESASRQRREALERERSDAAQSARDAEAARDAVQRRLAETEGRLGANLINPAGGSLIGGGARTFAAAQRLRDIDRAEKQAGILDELHAAAEKLDESNARLSAILTALTEG